MLNQATPWIFQLRCVARFPRNISNVYVRSALNFYDRIFTRGSHAQSFDVVPVDVMLERSRADWTAFTGLLSVRSCLQEYGIHWLQTCSPAPPSSPPALWSMFAVCSWKLSSPEWSLHFSAHVRRSSRSRRATVGRGVAANGTRAVIYDAKESMVTRLIRYLYFDGLFLNFCMLSIRRTPECN